MIRNKFVRTKMRPKVGAKIELQREISQIGLQVTCYRSFAGLLEVAYRFFAMKDPDLDFSSERDQCGGQWSQGPRSILRPLKKKSQKTQ